MDETNRFIHDMSVGTRFYKNEQKKEAILQIRVNNLLKKLEQYQSSESAINNSQRTLELDRHIASLESTRDLTRTWLHIDMDAFYAAVELQSRPDLVGKPIAVGSMDMLATSNYEARKWGVRAGIPGFLAVQLCPTLEILPLNFVKYRAVSAVIRAVLADYDPNFQASSLDEATLDITDYLSLRPHHGAVSVATEIRTRILQQTGGLTCSMGIASTNLLAKICAEQNKPNGYYWLPSNRDSIVQFMAKLPVRKVPGIGKVTEKLLEAIGITKCRDILECIDTIFGIFPKMSAEFFLHAALGLAEKKVKNQGNMRKSISRENTFRDFYSAKEQLQKCLEISADLAEELSAHNLEAKCITLKLKTIDFDVKTKITVLERLQFPLFSFIFSPPLYFSFSLHLLSFFHFLFPFSFSFSSPFLYLFFSLFPFFSSLIINIPCLCLFI
eukprot:Phypoly_transcript_09316.p1 GENE.Phypoly_transcript_09316~~Phypoly_transcript_09316.p1  ORF type:complete len:458 (+),score=73.29 Phypoly_transcript_09316:50-1375(+)